MTLQMHTVGIHEKKIRGHFGELGIPPDTRPVEDAVAIMVFMNRSGSSLVSEYLRATGAFSGFGEPLNYDLVIERAKKHGVRSFAGYLDWLMKNIHRTGTQFGLKTSFDQAAMLIRSGAIPRYFSNVRWVFLQRRDILSQAISFSIAAQTQQWHSFERSNGKQPDYDFDDIKRRAETIASNYAATQCLLSLSGVTPYFLVYEDFLVNPLLGTRKLAAYLGVDGVTVEPSRLRMQRQGNEINAQFKARFIEDFRRWNARNL